MFLPVDLKFKLPPYLVGYDNLNPRLHAKRTKTFWVGLTQCVILTTTWQILHKYCARTS